MPAKRRAINFQQTATPTSGFILITVLCSMLLLSPLGAQLEDNLGLALLFKLRGARPPPPDVVVVSIDEQTIHHLNLPNKLHQWDRSLHARLIQQLQKYGAAVIAFDIVFKDDRPAGSDQALAQAMQQANNVILTKDLMRLTFDTPVIRHAEREILPSPILVNHAAVVAGFVLPTHSQTINYAPLYKPTLHGIEATVPVMALQLYTRATRGRLIEALDLHGPPLAASTLAELNTANEMLLATRLHALFSGNPGLRKNVLHHLENNIKQHGSQYLPNLVNAYSQTEPAYINFYGPPQTLPTLPYHRIIQALAADETGALDAQLQAAIKGRIVFVGRSYLQQTKQADYHRTVFSSHKGIDISGVEIIATMVANLLDNSALKPLSGWQYLLLLLVWALLLFLSARYVSLRYWLYGVVLCVCLYGVGSLLLFKQFYLYFPVIGPLCVLTPALVLHRLIQRYRITRREADSTIATLRQYLPATAIATMSDNVALFDKQHKVMYGVCLLTDIQGFTTFAEAHSADHVHRVMNQYYHTLTKEVEHYKGEIANIVGDGLLALWTGFDCESEAKKLACTAALSIMNKLDIIGENSVEHPLLTCIGIHCGELSLGNLGGQGHFEYAPVGDTVNTTARIEAHNRTSGTRILISGAVQNTLQGFQTRPLGPVMFKGKRQAIKVYELLKQT